ncbi:MAG: ABC transporter permease [Bacteroidales bacterium]|nr:ABC transporter permease [Bacteroidales bacterium]
MNVEYIIKPQKGISLNLKEIWDYRELFYFFTWRDIKVKYKQTVLGFLWAILQPFLTMIIFTVFFGKLLGVPSDGIPYPIFAYSGLIIWNVFSGGLANSGNSMVSNANIIKKIYFPRLIIPMSAILVAVFDFLMAFVVFIGLMIYYEIPFHFIELITFIPASLILTIITVFGMGSFLAALNVKYRDFRYIIPFLIQSLMFLTPVIYPVSIIPYTWAKYVIAVNPMSGAVNLIRGAIINKPIEINMLIISCISAVILFFIGLLYFRKTERYFADIA